MPQNIEISTSISSEVSHFGVKKGCFPPIRMADFQVYGKVNNLDQTCYHMILSECKNSNFQSNAEWSLTASLCVQVFLSVLRT